MNNTLQGSNESPQRWNASTQGFNASAQGSDEPLQGLNESLQGKDKSLQVFNASSQVSNASSQGLHESLPGTGASLQELHASAQALHETLVYSLIKIISIMKSIGVLKWKDKSVANQILGARTISMAMAASAYFKTPNPVLADIDTATDNLETAQQAMATNGGGTKFTIARDGCRAILQNQMAQLVAYVNNIANGNADVIKDAAIELKKTPTRKGRLAATDRINAEGVTESTIKLVWKGVSGAAMYHVQMSKDVNPLAWQEFAGNLVTDTKTVVNNLPSGDRLWFRVIAVNAAGEGAPSNPVVVRVP